MLNVKRFRFPVEILRQCVSWVVAYSVSDRQIGEMMAERGVQVDHRTLQRWAIRSLPVLTERFRQQKKAVGTKWRMAETDVHISAKWQYVYRAVDSEGKTVDVLLCDKRDHAAALSCFQQAMAQYGQPSGCHRLKRLQSVSAGRLECGRCSLHPDPPEMQLN
ncbi:IS6 family transposase [Parachitinimonas caeni]|uniref:IS6 family transposase n=1 Tax=Parachitinimonas caeni TaxID=3031301 RepID=A0ABT7DZC9_9NEIS|nr:IS6 family transposase [Parachitinimonas caeni]MDK2125418.1 IS6 family transposase [Parachitinimonas caeni]